jgi:hypothetical protein
MVGLLSSARHEFEACRGTGGVGHCALRKLLLELCRPNEKFARFWSRRPRPWALHFDDEDDQTGISRNSS